MSTTPRILRQPYELGGPKARVESLRLGPDALVMVSLNYRCDSEIIVPSSGYPAALQSWSPPGK